MSNTCGNCDCSDVSQCVKKANSYVFEIAEKSDMENQIMGMPAAAGENDGACKCGSTCSCTNCACGGSH